MAGSDQGADPFSLISYFAERQKTKMLNHL